MLLDVTATTGVIDLEYWMHGAHAIAMQTSWLSHNSLPIRITIWIPIFNLNPSILPLNFHSEDFGNFHEVFSTFSLSGLYIIRLFLSFWCNAWGAWWIMSCPSSSFFLDHKLSFFNNLILNKFPPCNTTLITTTFL